MRLGNGTYAQTATGTSLSFNHASNGNYLLVFGHDASAAASTVTGITADGVAMTKLVDIRTHSGSGRMISLWFLMNPAQGTIPIVVSSSSSQNLRFSAQSVISAKQLVPTIYGTKQGDSAPIDLSLTTVDADSWMFLFGKDEGGGVTYTSTTGDVLLLNADAGGHFIAASLPILTPGSNSMSFSQSSAVTVGLIGVVLSPLGNKTDEHVSDANTRALWHLDGTVASAAKKDNAEGDATWDLNETGTLNAATGFNGEANGAYYCNGVGGLYTSTDFTDYATGAITIDLWMKNPTGSTAYQFMIVVNNGGTETFAFYKSGTSWYFNINVGGASKQISVPEYVLDDGLWHYIALTYDGSNVKLYIDGVQYGSSLAATGNIRTSDPSPLGIGCWGESPGNYRFTGYLDEVRIKATALTALEISDYYLLAASSLNEMNLNRTPVRGVGRGIMRP